MADIRQSVTIGTYDIVGAGIGMGEVTGQLFHIQGSCLIRKGLYRLIAGLWRGLGKVDGIDVQSRCGVRAHAHQPHAASGYRTTDWLSITPPDHPVGGQRPYG